LKYKGANKLEDAVVKLEKEMDFMTLEMVKHYADLCQCPKKSSIKGRNSAEL